MRSFILFLLVFLSFNNVSQDNNVTFVPFWGYTNDEILLNDSSFMMSESPLAVISEYKNIFQRILIEEVAEDLPRINEKSFTAKWTIINNSLYLYDILIGGGYVTENGCFHVFDSEPEINAIYKQAHANRFSTVEKFLSRKFTKIKSFDKKVMLADWYSGTLYMKRFPKDKEFYLSEKYLST
jgi:hypothetical protein